MQQQWVNYMPLRRIHRCWEHFRTGISDLERADGLSRVDAALRVLEVTQRAVLVKIEVASHADAFVLFESLNNRGMPLTQVDLIKNHLLARAEHTGTMTVDEAFARWSQMLAGLGGSYANQERFLRHYNAFKADLPEVPNATVATRSNLIRIYEQLVEDDVTGFLDAIVPASRVYGRITGVIDEGERLDAALRRLSRAQGAPSYVLMQWLMTKQAALQITDPDLITVAEASSHHVDDRILGGSLDEQLLGLGHDGEVSGIGEGLHHGGVEAGHVLEVGEPMHRAVGAADLHAPRCGDPQGLGGVLGDLSRESCRLLTLDPGHERGPVETDSHDFLLRIAR